ncbi:hypothetical protein ACHQM5_010710 [Ranunculus cassubicifolius]
MRSMHILLRPCMVILLLLYVYIIEAQDIDIVTPVNIGVILDMDTWVAKVSTSCMYMAISDFYSTNPDFKTRLVLHPRDSKMEVTGAAFAAMDLIQNSQVQAIIGPQKSEQTEFIVDLGDKVKIPIISFSATIPSIYSRSPYFIRTTPDDHTQVRAIASIVQSFRWRNVILIHEDTDYGNRLVPHLINAFQDINTRISYRSVVSPFCTDKEISDELKKVVLKKTSIFVLHMSASFGSRFLLKAKESGMMTEGYVWIITNGLMNVAQSLKSSVIDSMQGILGVDSYIPTSQRLKTFIARWKQKMIEENPDIDNAEMVNFGLHAYDTIWALAMAFEKVGNMNYTLTLEVDKNTADDFGMGVSETGPKLLQEIVQMEFEGLCGKFKLVNGQLQSSAFQILNVVGNGLREIGFWTSKYGISRNLNFSSDRKYSNSANHFRAVIWPGKSKKVPKGWVIPSNKKLRIGVPMHDGFNELVNVKRDPLTNFTIVTGYSIDVFKSVIKLLSYSIPYEFFPLQGSDGKSAISYNDIIHQVQMQNYDAVVGDVTITANRSLYVDFTFPYTNGGVYMIVPLKRQEDTKNRWVFFLSPPQYFGMLSIKTNIVTGFMLWLLQQIGQICKEASSYKLVRRISKRTQSMITHEYRKKISTILSHSGRMFWYLSMAGLVQTYLVTLESVLTRGQLEPTITDFSSLIKRGDFVGYRQGGFIEDLLKQLQFEESKMKPYSSSEEFHDLLSRGSKYGGVAAAFDEMPYVDIFLAKYCSKYSKVGPIHKTDGYGFVFPLGSPLVTDVSRAVLEVTEGSKLLDIEKAWFSPNGTCDRDKWSLFASADRSNLVNFTFCVIVITLHIKSNMFKRKQKQS